jgi:23S rRNA (adenine2503-C2)-methyltransferase
VSTANRVCENRAHCKGVLKSVPMTATATQPGDLVDLRDLDYDDMQELAARLGQPRFRGEQLFRWVHSRGSTDVSAMTDVSKALRAQLQGQVKIVEPAIDLEQVAKDGTRKLRLRTHDDRLIETVLIPDDDVRTIAAGSEHDDDDEEEERRKLTQCVSSQVGCAIDCDFCATAKLGFGRHLSVGEIVGQVYLGDRLLGGLPPSDPTRRAGGDRVTNLVFMGMGEPLHNLDNLLRALRILLHPLGRSFSRRRITVSTAGLVPAIERLAAEGLPVNLAVSLNASHDAQRDRLMPINKKYPLSELLGALRRFPLERRQRITFEYVLLRGINDSLDDVRRLPELLRGIPCKLNVIPWNPHPHSPYARPESARVHAFQEEAMRLGFTVFIRKTRGDDIDAACGQLAADRDPRAGQARKIARLPVMA